MGSPIVFQTTPPHPASNARIACPMVLVAGPDASQNGFVLLIPAKRTVRSAIGSPVSRTVSRTTKPRIQPARCGHPFRNGIDYFLAAVRAIASGEILRVTGLVVVIDSHSAILIQLKAFDTTEKFRNRLLPHRAHYHIDFNGEFSSRHRQRSAATLGVDWTELSADAFQPGYQAVRTQYPHRLRLPEKSYSVFFSELILVRESGHLQFAAAINHIHDFCAESARRGHNIDCRIAGADTSHASPDFNLFERLNLRLFDKFDRGTNT